MLAHFLKKTSLLGIDIQSHSIQLIAFQKKQGKLWFQGQYAQALPSFFSQVEEQAQLLHLEQIFKKLWEKERFTTRAIAIALPEEEVIMKTLALPPTLKLEEIKAVIFLEIEKNWPGIEKKDLCIDFSISALASRNTGLRPVLFAFTKKRKVEKRILAFQRLGFSVKAVEPESFAMARSLFFINWPSLSLTGNETLAFLDLNFPPKLMVFKDKKPLYYKKAKLALECERASFKEILDFKEGGRKNLTKIESFTAIESLLFMIEALLEDFYLFQESERIEKVFLNEDKHLKILSPLLKNKWDLSIQTVLDFPLLNTDHRRSILFNLPFDALCAAGLALRLKVPTLQ